MNNNRIMIVAFIVSFFVFIAPFTTAYGADQWTIGPTAQIGGWRDTIDVQGSYAYINEGISMKVFNISGDQPQLTGSITLPYEPVAIKVNGNHAYVSVAQGSSIWFGLVNISNPSNPVLDGSCNLSPASGWQGGKTAFYDKYAYVTGGPGQNTLFVVDVSDKARPQSVATVPVASESIFIRDGKAYIVGQNTSYKNEFNIYDLSQSPTNPTKLSSIVQTGSTLVIRGTKDIYVSGSHAYIAGGGSASLQFIDVTNPSLPKLDGYYSVQNANIDGVTVVNNRAYVLNTSYSSQYFKGLTVLDVTNKNSVTELGRMSINNPVQFSVILPYVYALTGDDNEIQKMHVADPTNMSVKGSYVNPLMASSLAGVGDTIYYSSDTKMWVYDIANPSSPTLVKTYTDWQTYNNMISAGNTIYAINGKNFYVVNAQDRMNLQQLASYARDTSANQQLVVSNGYAFIRWGNDTGSEGKAIDIINANNPSAPVKMSTLPISGVSLNILAYCAANNKVYVAYRTGASYSQFVYKIDIFDVSNPSSPVKTGSVTPKGYTTAIAVASNTLFVAGGSFIQAFDVSNPAAPVLAKETNPNVSFSNIKAIELPDAPTIGNLLVMTGHSLMGPASIEPARVPEQTPLGEMPGETAGVYTYSYTTGVGFTAGGTCESAYPYDLQVVQTPSSTSNYTVITNDMSYGTYIQRIQTPQGNKANLTMNIQPAEAAKDGCSTEPTVGTHMYDKNESVSLSATAKEPWNFKEWTGSVSGSNPNVNVVMDTNKLAVANYVKPVLTLSPGSQNPNCEKVAPGATNFIAAHIVLSVNDVDDWQVNTVSFKASGSGNEQEDIIEARLYLGNFNGELLGRATYAMDNGAVGFTVNKKIAKGSSISLMMVYDFKADKACPCKTYSSKITVADVGALPLVYPNFVKLPKPPEGVTSEIEDKEGELKIDETTNNQGAKKLKPLPTPLKVKAENISTDCVTWYKVRFWVDPKMTPQGSTGYKFSSGGTEYEIDLNANKEAEAVFTVGDRPGKYIVYAELKLKPNCPYSCQCYGSVANVGFDTFATGILLVPQFDGVRDDDKVGTFISTIEAQNKLTASVQLPPGDSRKVNKMIFNLDGDIKEDTSEPFEATYDMAAVKETSNLHMIAEMSDGSKMEDDFPFYAIPFPGWINIVQKLQSFIKWEFQPDDQRYRISFTYPGDFIWQRPIESYIPLIGGEDNEAKASFTIAADYYISQNSGLRGEGKVNSEILGKAFNVDGSVDATFDRNFKLLPGANAKLGVSVDFPIPEKTLASKTILVYGVPVTLAIDLGGNVRIFVNGSVVFDDQFRFQKMTFIPGTTLTLDITASASVAFGLAKIGVKGSPTGTLKIKLSYTTPTGVTMDAFGGEIVIPISVFGSLFWGTVSGELGSTTLGPYAFGDQIGPLSYPLMRTVQSTTKHFYSTSGVATDEQGRKLLIWTKDTSTSADAINPEIAFRIDTGSGFGDIGYITNNQFWEIDPVVTFLSNGNALALWTSNKGAKTLNNLKDILSNQDIAYSYYNGSTWTQEAPVINDDRADGNAGMAYDPVTNKAMAVWVKSGSDPMDKTAWSVYYSLFDAANLTWTSPQAMTGTTDTTSNFAPTVTSDGKGKFIAVWVKDVDGKLFAVSDNVSGGSNTDNTNSDCNLYYNVYTNGAWSQPASLTQPNDFTEFMPSATFTKDGNIALVWVQKEGNKDKLYSAVYNPSIDKWSAPQLMDEGGYLIEDPRISVDSNNKATIVYRKNSENGDDLYSIEKDLSGIAPQAVSSPKRLTYNDETEMWLSTAATSDGKIFLSSTGIGKDDLSPPGIGDNIVAGIIDPVKKATLTGTNSEQPVSAPGGKYASIEATIGVNVSTSGKFSLRAGLFDASGNLILYSESASQELAAGTGFLKLMFSGRKINVKGLNGPYTIKDIVLLDASLSPIAIDYSQTGFATRTYTSSQFIEGRLSLNKDVYFNEADSMHIKVVDENGTGSVIVKLISSAMGIPLFVALNSTSTGVFEGTVKFSTTASASDTLKVENAGVIRAVYTDASKEEWEASAAWIDKKYDLTLNTGWNFISIPVQPINTLPAQVLKDVSPLVRVVWSYDNQAKQWLKYRDQGSGVGGQNTLAAIEAGKGYWIYMNKNSVLSVPGIDVSPNVKLYEGWNLSGYNGTDSWAVTNSLSNIQGKWIIVWNWESGQWSAKTANTGITVNVPEFTVFNRGRAYWIKMKEGTEWAQ